jgi:hypothetical protein
MLRFIALIASLPLSTPAAAVSCGGQESVKRAYSSAQHVFSAHVERIYLAPGFGRDEFQFAELRVLKVWKGGLNSGDTVEATAEESISFVSDGFVPLQGSDVLVYSVGSQPLVLSTCSRTTRLDSSRDLRALEKLSNRSHGR